MFKKILIYGENWTGTLPRLIHDDLTRRGYVSEVFDFTDYVPGIKNRTFVQKVRRRLFPGFYKRKVQKLFLQKVAQFNPELIIVVKGLHLGRDTLKEIKKSGCPVVNWNPDDFFNLKNSNASLIQAMPAYDLIVSSREHLFDKYREHGASAILFLDWYYVPELHFDHKSEKTIAASFVGSWSPSREKFLSELKIEFSIWGSGWEKSSASFKKRHDVKAQILSQIEMSKVFSMSKYNLNLLTHENCDLSNLRFFEVPASGGLLLTERNGAATKYLTDGEDCLMFSSSDEVNQLLSQDFDLGRIAQNGNKRMAVYSNTFAARVDELLSYVNSHFGKGHQQA